MKLLLTGGTGFFGKSLLRYWCELPKHERPEEVTIVSRNPDVFLSNNPDFIGLSWLTFYKGDVQSFQTMQDLDDGYTHLLHAATDSTYGPKLSPLQRYSQIVDGTRNMLELAVKKDIQRFLLTSSGGVYGPQPAGMEKIPETYLGMPDPLDPNNAYSVAKRTAEHLCALYQNQYGIETVIARCFAFVGQDLPLDVHFAIGNFIRDAINGNDIVIHGDGTPVRSYMDQRDLAVWLYTLLKKGYSGQAYNVGSDYAVSIYELAYMIKNIVNSKLNVKVLGENNYFTSRVFYVPDINKSKELGLKINFTLDQSIQDSLY